MTLSLTLAQADAIARAALEERRRLDLQPMSVVVLDTGGHLITARRDDGAGYLRFEIAHGKAWGALGMGFGTRELAERADWMPAFLNAIAATSGGRVIPSPGGVLILDDQGRTTGALGLSGDTGDNDERCALGALATAGWGARPG
ncbi:GlcG/HbpS family heme-binding protein [Alloalcanivorax gelatiniphagus]|uniref:Heme-binding protein n=1 Tax=Alloalcanivorax gelatiniphagus TaxID=1194167 RepID=A0ABY2XNV6_9GAMM|nr:heme-binding protein [Alloalcanivorax gelatiniphagus]TMW13691.1 heme-binding protein [Alloalcanivorax gelatiniphagus]